MLPSRGCMVKLSRVGVAGSASAILMLIASAAITSPAEATTFTASPIASADSLASFESVSQSNARRMALEYLDYSAFSRTGLIEQLQYEGFSRADATYGADATHTNWYKQAALMAAEYLDYSSFSGRGLIDQLKYEGFTTAQATYGVRKVGL